MNVAHDANLDSTNLRKYIRGIQEMRYTTLLRIANAIGVTPSQILEDLKTIKEGVVQMQKECNSALLFVIHF